MDKSIVRKNIELLLSDDLIKKHQRWGLAYSYDQEHPFLDFNLKIDTKKILDILSFVAAAYPPTLPIVEAINTGATVLPSEININLKSHQSTIEVPIDNLSKNFKEIENSLSNFTTMGIPSLAYKYYDISKQIRKLESNGKFSNTIKYMCQPNYLVAFSNGTNPSDLSRDNLIDFVDAQFVINALLGSNVIFNTIAQLVSSVDFLNITKIIIRLVAEDFPEFNRKTISVDSNDEFVKNYIYKEYNQNLNFNSWNNEINLYGKYGLAFLSANHESNDMISQNELSQNIDTIIVGYDVKDSNYDYLYNGVSYINNFGRRIFDKLSVKQFKSITNNKLEFFKKENNNNISLVPPILIDYTSKNPLIAFTILNINDLSSRIKFKPLKQTDETLSADELINDNTYKNVDFGNLTQNDQTRRVILSSVDKKPVFLNFDDDFNKWLMRISDKSDSDINSNLRKRCDNNDCSTNNLGRMIGDITTNSLLYFDDNVDENKKQFLVTQANDGMVYVFSSSNDDIQSSMPFSLKLNYIPGSLIAKSDDKDYYLWDSLKIIAKSNYGKSPNNIHRFFLNGEINYLGITKKSCSNDVCIKKPTEINVIGGAGQGAKGVYALNIGGREFINDDNLIGVSREKQLDQKEWVKEVPLWESNSNQFGFNKTNKKNFKASKKLGYVITAPQIAPITLTRFFNDKTKLYEANTSEGKYYAAFVPNGIFNDDKSPALYIYNLNGIEIKEFVNNDGSIDVTNSQDKKQAGRLIKKLIVGDKNNKDNEEDKSDKDKEEKKHDNKNNEFGSRQGLVGVTVLDIDEDGIADLVYGTDYEGNVYRFDLRAEDEDKWKVLTIYKGAGLDKFGRPLQPIISAPSVYKLDNANQKYVVIFGTGSNIFSDDLYDEKMNINKNIQSIYAIYDDLTEDEIIDTVTYNQIDNFLVEQKLEEIIDEEISLSKDNENDNKLRIVDAQDITMDKKGWYINFATYEGERVIYKPIILKDAVIFGTKYYDFEIDNKNMCSNYKTKVTSWIMALRAANGGQLNNNTFNLGKTSQENKFFNGIRSSFNVSKFYLASKINYNINAQGEYRPGWESKSLSTIRDNEKNTCLVFRNGRYISSINCDNSKVPSGKRWRRLGWREIL